MARPLSSKYSVELGFRFPKRVGENLKWWRYAVLNQDQDFVCIIDGDEGKAKSHTIQHIAYFMDIDSFEDTGEVHPVTKKPIFRPTGRKLELNQIVFDFDECRKAIRELPPFKSIIYDEAGRSTDRRKSMDKENIEFNQLMREARQYNKFLFLVMQSFYDMDLQMAVRRSKCLFHMMYRWNSADELTPMILGDCRFYDEEAKKQMYCNDYKRKYFMYSLIPNHSFDVQFGYHWVVDHDEYKKKKREAELRREKKDKRIECPECGSTHILTSKDKISRCRKCGNEWKLLCARNSGITHNKPGKGEI